MKKEKFQPIFLFQQSETPAILRKQYREVLSTLKPLQDAAELLIGRTLSADEKILIFRDKDKFIENMKTIIRERFKFPEATETFNLSYLGLTFNQLDAAAKQIPAHSFSFEIGEDGFLPLDSEFERFTELGKVYTNSETQNDLYNKLSEICRLTDELRANHGFKVVSSATFHLEKAFGKHIECIDGAFQINGKRIAHIK